MKKLYLFFLLWSPFGFAQEKIPFLDGQEITQLAAEAAGEGDYQKALEVIGSIHPKDSLFNSSLVPKSYYLLQTGKFDEAVAVAEEGLDRSSGALRLSFHINKTVGYINSDQQEKAMASVEEGMKVYPRNYQLWYNKGRILEKMNRKKEAVEAYQQSVLLNPGYAPPHLRLGNISYQQDLTAQAMMAFNVYLVLNPDGSGAFDVLKGFNELVRTKNPNSGAQKIEISGDDSSFKELNLLLDNRLALNDQYEVESELNIALTKQNHLLLSQLAGYQGGEGFWSRVYVPLFQWVWKNNHFSDFTKVVSFSIENEEYKKIVTKDIEGLKTFRNSLLTEWQNNLQVPDFRVLESDRDLYYNYVNLNLDAIGPSDGKIQTGAWKFFDGEGLLIGKGTFDQHGKRTGIWTWYHDNDRIRETANYKGGKLEGENKAYYRNGRPQYTANYKEDQLDGEHLFYNQKGALIEKKYFTHGALEGDYRSNFPVGEVLKEFDVFYRNGLVEGKAYEYYANGNVYSEMNFKAGEKQGVERNFHRDGSLFSELNYQANKAEGPYTTYFVNGTTSERSTYKADLFEGEYEVFYEDGTLQSVGVVKEGLYQGLYKAFDRDGKLYYEFDYKNGEIIAYRYFDKKGEIISSGKRKGGEFHFRSHAPHGEITAEGIYDLSGGKKGFWKFYSDNGVLTGEGEYVDDKTIGLYTTYAETGEKISEANYKENTLHGYFRSFYPDGKTESQGWYKEGQQHGEWRFYYPDGNLQTKNFYHKGDFHDQQEFYGVDGNLTSTILYAFGEVLNETYYTPEGDLFEKVEPKEGNHTVRLHHFNGKVSYEIDYVNGVKHGKYTRFDHTGKKLEEGSYLNGQQNGSWVTYHSNGEKESLMNFSNGEFHGRISGFYENGQPEIEHEYVFGSSVEESTFFHENGQVSVTTQYKAGKDHGRKEFFDPSGRLELVRFYEFGRLVGYSYLDENSKELPMIPLQNETGQVQAFFDNGKVSREIQYDRGHTVGPYKSYYYSGSPRFEAVYRAGEYHGVVKEFYPDGKVKSEKNYHFGVLHGPVRMFHQNGRLKEETSYVYDVKHGESVFFDEQGNQILKEKYINGDVYDAEQI